MTSLQPAARRRAPARRPQRTARSRRLPGILGWSLAGIGALCIAAKVWPEQTIAVIVIVAALALIRVARPAHAPVRRPRTAEGFYHLTPTEFEHAIAGLARADSRVRSAQPVGGSGDGGIDVRVELHTGARWFIQCKRNQHGNNVGPGVIRDANGSYRELHGCHHAAVITTAGFTAQAKNTNERFEYPLALFTGQDVEAWACGGPAPWDRRLRRG